MLTVCVVAWQVVEMLVKRTPYAMVLSIRRESEKQNIGIKRNEGTAEVSQRSICTPNAPEVSGGITSLHDV